jgi:uncharacterized sporulation protein YeaH/YhbH (DUF444 family)
MKIDSDLSRFKDILRGRVKSDLKRFATSEDMIAQQGGRTIKIPLKSIDLPRFAFGGRGMGGTGQGDEQNGDPFGQGKGKPGQGDKAGDGTEDHMVAEFTMDELADMIKEELQLPDLEPKGKGSVSSEKAKYNQVGDVGVIRSYKRTYREALKRSLSSGIYSPNEPIVVPIRKDFRYKISDVQPKPEISAVLFYVLDISGSMSDDIRTRAQKISFWIDAILGKTYKNLTSVFIAHDTKAKICEDKKEFFSITSGGGTMISSAFSLVAQLIEKEFPFSENNVFIYQFSDGDNYDEQDNHLCGSILKEKILPNCNAYNFGETKSNGGSGDFARYLESQFANEHKINLASVASDDDVLSCIKCFFEKAL